MNDVVSSWLNGETRLDSLDELAKRFGLDELAASVLALTWAAERSLPAAKRAREAAGPAARGLTVEVVRDALKEPVDAALAAGAPLRRHALVTVDVAGPPLPTSELRLAAGVGPRLEGAPLPLDEFAPGVRLLRDADAQFPASAKIAEMAKDKLFAREPLLATVDGCGRREALALGVAAARRSSRGLLAVDGEVLAGLAGRWELLAALRREADLEGLVLLVYQAAALGEAWRALAVAPPEQAARPALIVLADGVRTREVTLVDGLRHQSLTLGAEKPAEAAKVEVKLEDPYELIRKQAQRDAERALGVWRGEPATAPPPKPAEAPKVEAVVPPPPPAPPPKVEAAPPPPPKVEEPKVEAAPPGEKTKKRRSKKNTPPAAEAAPPPPAAPEPPAPDPDALSADAPYLPVPPKPTPDMLALIARTSKNPRQRLELLEELKSLKIPSVVQAMRDNALSTDPKIKALAEATMASFFGANWNRTRPVAKPVQPPVSDDKNPNRPW